MDVVMTEVRLTPDANHPVSGRARATDALDLGEVFEAHAAPLYRTILAYTGGRADVAEDLFGVARIDRFAFDIELIYVALHRNYDIKRIPVVLANQEGTSVRLLTDAPRVMADLVRIRWAKAAGAYVPVREVHNELDPPKGWSPGR